MSTLMLLKKIALVKEDEYLKKCMKMLDNYVDKHSGANIRAYIEDGAVSVYDGKIFLLKISTVMLEGDDE